MSSRYKKDLKRVAHQKDKLTELGKVIDMLATDQVLPIQYKDHSLQWKQKNCREYHIFPNFLLVYEKDEDMLLLYLLRAWSHSDLF